MQTNLLWLKKNDTNADMLRCEGCNKVTHAYCAGFGNRPPLLPVPAPESPPWFCPSCCEKEKAKKSKSTKRGKSKKRKRQ